MQKFYSLKEICLIMIHQIIILTMFALEFKLKNGIMEKLSQTL